MDLSKTPSLQSLVESDIGSVDSLHSLNIEELDEAEYALPPTAEPTLAELLDEPDASTDNSALQVELLQALSQQLKSAEERSEAGAATTLAIGGPNGEWVAAGTAHGHVLAFAGGAQTLRWACGALREGGAVAALAYCAAGARLLVAHARGTVAQREARSGRVLRRVALGGGAWGALAVAWAGAAGLALDTGGSVWLLRFSRPLGVRTTRPSCLFSGARGEVVCMSARDGRVVALATLQRVVVVAGARAAAVPLRGPAHFLPLLAWRAGVLCCARATTLLWVAANATRGAVELRVLRRVEVRAPLIWLGWLDARLALIDSGERLRLFDDEEDDAAADISFVEPVYASAFFKGVWTEGRVSGALAAAGASALGGAASGGGTLLVLGRAGVVRARAAGARALAARGRWARALRTAAPHERAALLASLAAEPRTLHDPATAAAAVQLCLRHQLRDELWGELWESGSEADEFVWAVGEAAAEGALDSDMAPPPAAAQLLVRRLADTQPPLLERALLALPLTCLDPHQASGLAHKLGLWRAAAALAEALGGGREAAARELGPLVGRCRAGGGAGACRCPGDALLLRAADGLAGRGLRGALPAHAQPALRHETLGALLADGAAALRMLLAHDARSCCRLLEMAFPEPPFVGPLGRQNKLRVARALLACLDSLPHEEDRVEVAHFVATQLGAGALPNEPELMERVRECAAGARGHRADAAWLAVLARVPPPALPAHLDLAADRPRVRRRILALLGRREEILDTFLEGNDESQADEMSEYLHRCAATGDGALRDALARRAALVARAGPAAFARLLVTADWRELVPAALAAIPDARRLLFTDELLELGALEGDAAREHLRLLCAHRPGAVLHFLGSSPGAVRPEEALELVRLYGVTDAEPHCLEALGDAEGALTAALRLVETAIEEERRRALASRACELCARLASGAPPAAAAALWGRFVACEAAVRRVAAGALLESAAHVPVGTLVEHVCGSSGGARLVLLALLRGASGRALGAGAASRILGKELHVALARDLKGGGRAVRVRSASCEACRWPLESRAPVRCYPCGHAAHVACGAAERCARCECAAEREVRSLGVAGAVRRQTLSGFALQLTAPPRPDLEGAV